MSTKHWITAVLLCYIISGCQHYGADKTAFPETVRLEASITEYDELLVVNNITLLNGYLILQNGADNVDDFYYVFSYPELKFLYSFATYGRGPGEFMMPAIIKNTKDGIFAFKDHYSDLIAWYEISDTCAVLIDPIYFKSPDTRFFWELNQLSDSTMLTKHQNHNDGRTELWNIHKTACVDSVANTFSELPDKMGKEYFSIYDDYMISCNGNRFAAAYYMIDRIEFGQISDQRIEKVSSVGEDRTPDFFRYGYNEKRDFNIDKNIIYYENLYVTSDFVYALYSNKRMDITEQEHSKIIEKYSWTGQPVARYELDHPIAYFVVDETTHSIYGTNPSMDNMVLKYTFD